MHCPFCRTPTPGSSTPGWPTTAARSAAGAPARPASAASPPSSRCSYGAQAHGATEPFTRDKAVAGVRKACKGRPVTEDQLAPWARRSRTRCAPRAGRRCRPTRSGLAILGPLRELDEVAYLRFASVYRAFESADDFEEEIARMRTERAPAVTAHRRPQPPG